MNVTMQELRAAGRATMRVYTSAQHTFGTDAVLLAHFAAPRAKEQVCDLGTGCGILPMLWRGKPALTVGVEIQEEAAALARRAATENGLDERVRILCADWQDAPSLLGAGGFDRVTCNPPYFAAGTGAVNPADGARLARHESVGSALSDVTASAVRLLKFGGVFCVCYRPERLCDLMVVLRGAGLEPKRLQFVQQRADSAPWLVLCEAKKGGAPSLRLLPPLVLQNPDGTSSAAYREIYACEE